MKEWYIRGTKVLVETDPHKLMQLIEEMEESAKAEMENANASIPMLEVDSRLGWEPCLEYVGSPDRIAWKEKIDPLYLERRKHLV